MTRVAAIDELRANAGLQFDAAVLEALVRVTERHGAPADEPLLRIAA
jgi:HD-GYP domain-containing protein (c-di-GMP phosphodiesterase class II)